MNFGAHVSIAGGVENAPKNAAALGCEVFQMFSRSPRGGKVKPITEEQEKAFKDAMKEHDQKEVYIHTPYLINLASDNKRTYGGSVQFIRTDLERASQLGAKYVMTHIGSAKDRPHREAITSVVNGLAEILDGYKGSAELLLENTAGAGQTIGRSFEELAQILDDTELKKYDALAGICYDTQHGFASGYDIRTPEALTKTLDEFENILDLSRLKLFHGNDSKVPFESNKDRHECLGKGEIGTDAFWVLTNEARIEDIDIIVETPEHQEKDVELLKEFRDEA